MKIQDDGNLLMEVNLRRLSDGRQKENPDPIFFFQCNLPWYFRRVDTGFLVASNCGTNAICWAWYRSQSFAVDETYSAKSQMLRGFQVRTVPPPCTAA